ncbi:hypothetical protein G6011_03134 [Alternaria panax]|uniref:Major facilitator superfamily (MFS) profile domain-containing protein n=1 Tax=Alternaria panax TaxID=48097 RepID=A0AAD4IEJ6_9PLEO|nr:hypothetical protein G6011_03134 [Alternaria panax]
MEDACDNLTTSQEWEGDGILVATARLAKIAISAAEVSRRASDDPSTARHAMMAIEPLLLALGNLQRSLAPECLQHWLIIGFIQTAQVAIYDLALLRSSSIELPASHLTFESRRIEYLMELLQTCKACRDHALTSDVMSLTAPSILVWSYCCKIVYRLSSIKGIPGWDPTNVQSNFDIVQCLEQFAEMAERVNTEFKAKSGEDTLFAAAAETLRAMAPNWKLPTSEHDEATAIPRITSEFHPLPDVGWYIGAFALASATLQPLSGKLYTHFSTKIVFLTFVLLFELGFLLCGVASSSAVLVVGRVVAGLGASGIVNSAMTMLAGAVPTGESPVYTGIVLGTAQTGIVAGPLIGGALTEHATWRWCFYMNLLIGEAATALIAFVPIPERTLKSRIAVSLFRKVLPDLDLFGFALFVPPSVMLLLALQLGSGGTYAWGSSVVVGMFCGAGVCTIFFIL